METRTVWMPWVWCSLGVLVVGLYFINIHTGSLKAWDEGLTALRSFEMMSSNSFPTTIMLGQPDFNKPPLYYWLSAQTMKLFGVSILSVRLPGVLMGLLTHVLVVSLVWRRVLAVELRVLTVFLLLFNAHWMDHVRIGLLESGVACSMISALWLVDTVRIPRLVRVVGAGCLLAGGALLKHPGVLLAVIPMGYLLQQEKQSTWKRDVLLLCLIPLGLYAVWVAHQYLTWGNTFLSYYFEYNMLQRFGHGIEGHASALGYYVQRLFMKAPVTGILLVGTLFWAGWNFYRTRRGTFGLVLLSTFLLPFAALHLFASKREVYLVALYPFLAMAVPLLLDSLRTQVSWLGGKRIRHLVLAVVVLQVVCFIPRFDYIPDYSHAEKQAVETALNQSMDPVVGTDGMPLFLAVFYAHLYTAHAVDLQQCATPGIDCSALVLPAHQHSCIPSTEVFHNKEFAVRVVQ